MSSTNGFAEWFRRQLQGRGWNQAEFHHKSGISRASVSAWFRGTRVPDPPMIDIIADVFGLKVDDVLTLAGHRPDLGSPDPNSPAGRIHSMVDRIDWTVDGRERIVTLMFRDFIEQDRERKRGS